MLKSIKSKLNVRGLAENPNPKAMLLLEEPLFKEAMLSDHNLAICRFNLAKNVTKEAMKLLDSLPGSETEGGTLSSNPAKPAMMLLMNKQKKYQKYIDWNAVYNNESELAQFWVSIKMKSTPEIFKNCEKIPDLVEGKCETSLYTLAAREDEESLVVVESFVKGTWVDWLSEGSSIKPVVEREWNAVREDRDFWRILCRNKNPRILEFIFDMEEYIDWKGLSANPIIFPKSE